MQAVGGQIDINEIENDFSETSARLCTVLVCWSEYKYF